MHGSEIILLEKLRKEQHPTTVSSKGNTAQSVALGKETWTFDSTVMSTENARRRRRKKRSRV